MAPVVFSLIRSCVRFDHTPSSTPKSFTLHLDVASVGASLDSQTCQEFPSTVTVDDVPIPVAAGGAASSSCARDGADADFDIVTDLLSGGGSAWRVPIDLQIPVETPTASDFLFKRLDMFSWFPYVR